MYFNSPNDFAVYLQGQAIFGYKRACQDMLQDVGEAVQHDSADRIVGRIKPLGAVGQFPAWPTSSIATGIPFPAGTGLTAGTIARKRRKGWGKNGNPASILYATGKFQESITYRTNRSQYSVTIGTNRKEIAYTEQGTSKMAPRPVFGPAALTVLPKALPALTNHFGRTMFTGYGFGTFGSHGRSRMTGGSLIYTQRAGFTNMGTVP